MGAEAALLVGHGIDLIRLGALPALCLLLSCWKDEGAVAALLSGCCEAST